jgi:hypothetical protein
MINPVPTLNRSQSSLSTTTSSFPPFPDSLSLQLVLPTILHPHTLPFPNPLKNKSHFHARLKDPVFIIAQFNRSLFRSFTPRIDSFGIAILAEILLKPNIQFASRSKEDRVCACTVLVVELISSWYMVRSISSIISIVRKSAGQWERKGTYQPFQPIDPEQPSLAQTSFAPQSS